MRIDTVGVDMNRSEIRDTAIERRDTLSRSLQKFINAANTSRAEANQYYQNNQASRDSLQTRLQDYNKNLSGYYQAAEQTLRELNIAINATSPDAQKINNLMIAYSRNIGDVQSAALDIITAVHNASLEEIEVENNIRRNDELLTSFDSIADSLTAMLKENAAILDPQLLREYQDELDIHRLSKDRLVKVYAEQLNQNSSVTTLKEAGDQYTDMLDRLSEVDKRLQQSIEEASRLVALPATGAEKSDDQLPISPVTIAEPNTAKPTEATPIPEPESVHAATLTEPSSPVDSDDDLESASVGSLTPSTPSPISTPFMSPRPARMAAAEPSSVMPASVASAEKFSANNVLKEVAKTPNIVTKQQIMLKGCQDFLHRFSVERTAGSDVQIKVAKIEAEILGKLLQKLIGTMEKYDRKGNADNIQKLNESLQQIQDRIAEIEGKKPSQQPTGLKLG